MCLQPGLCRNWSETPKTGFLTNGLILGSVIVAEWPPFGKELLARLTVCYLCLFLCVIPFISRFGLEDRISGLTVPVPGHSFSYTVQHAFLHT